MSKKKYNLVLGITGGVADIASYPRLGAGFNYFYEK